MMRVVIGFVSGVIACLLLLFTVKLALPLRAETEDGLSANESGLASLLPDIEAIYQQSLLLPFEEAEKKITDPDIAAYYSRLLERTGLRAPGSAR